MVHFIQYNLNKKNDSYTIWKGKNRNIGLGVFFITCSKTKQVRCEK
jgi:hypothetical protein